MSAYQVVVGWTVLLVLLVLVAQTAIGERLIYGVLVLALVFLVLTQYKSITALLTPIGTQPS